MFHQFSGLNMTDNVVVTSAIIDNVATWVEVHNVPMTVEQTVADIEALRIELRATWQYDVTAEYVTVTW
jgi:hypothetical protein